MRRETRRALLTVLIALLLIAPFAVMTVCFGSWKVAAAVLMGAIGITLLVGVVLYVLDEEDDDE